MIHRLKTSLSRIIDNHPLKVTGNSMEPLFQSGDMVSFKKIPSNSVKINDMVLVGSRQNFFVHRVIYRNKSMAVTRGDNNLKSDGFISLNRIIARATMIERDRATFPPSHIYLIQSSHYLKEIIKINEAFESQNIKYIFLKGLPVHFFYEGSHPKKLYFDCDLLVDRKSAAAIDRIFIKNGYKRIDSSLIKNGGLDLKTAPEISYRKIISGFPVNFDVHFEAVFTMTQLPHLEPFYSKALLDRLTQELFRNVRIVKINGVSLPILRDEILVIYLSLHFFHHNFKGIQRLELIHKVIEKSRISKRKFYARCLQIVSTYHLHNFIYPVFLLLHKYFKTHIPQSFMKSISPKSKVFLQLISSKNRLDIFDSDSRINSGIVRFRNLFILSPRPLYIRLLVFLDPKVIFYFFYSSVKRLSYFLKEA